MFEKLTRVEFSNLDKILYPEPGITKAQVIEYYIRVASKILDFVVDRPLTITRFPNGINEKGFYEKDAPSGTPSWVEMYKRYSESAKRDLNYILCNSLDTLIWLANLAALEIHVTLSKSKSFQEPDAALFDIDPEPPANFGDATEATLLLKEKLDGLGLVSYVKTSGKKGLHVLVPIREGYSFSQTREFVHLIGRRLASESKNIVSEMSESKKPGTIFIDYLQNSHGRTMACPYSLRATPQATVSTPLRWDDVNKKLKPEDFNMVNIAKVKDDPWRDMMRNKQILG
ncbi:MAG: polymerase protein [Thermoproteota archaeon]|nr:polymerase protein [Thermoproteota archaeon]